MQVLCNKLMDKNSRDFFCSLMEKAHEDSGYSDDEEEGAGEVKKEPATEEQQGVCFAGSCGSLCDGLFVRFAVKVDSSMPRFNG